MSKPPGTILGILFLLALALAFGAPGNAAADDCVALGGSILGGECVVSSAVVVAPKASPPAPAGDICAFTLDETLHIQNGGSLTVTSACTATVRPPFVPATGAVSTPALKIIVTAPTAGGTDAVLMDAGSKIIGDATAGHAADIEIRAVKGNITLAGDAPQPGPLGAIIQSNRSGTCNAPTSRGGNIVLDVQEPFGPPANKPEVAQGKGSKIDSISPCGRGEIDIFAVKITLDGEVLSEGTTSQGRGGPITVNAGCDLKVTGSVVSKGKDPGADLVHLQGGCTVTIWGLVASTGPGHAFSNVPPHRCEPPFRPNKPVNSDACVEVWSGGTLEIDAKNHNGEVHADTAQSGGPEGFGWIELFAKGTITVTGDTQAPFAIHANQFLQNSHGGQITVKSTEGQVLLTGLAIQASACESIASCAIGTPGAAGGSGSRPDPLNCTTQKWCGGVFVQADTNVSVAPDGVIQAKGGTTGGGSQHGGFVDLRSFAAAILAGANSKIDVTGDTPPDGVVNLTACTTPIAAFPPGTVVPAGITPTKNSPVCGGAPSLPTYPAGFGIPGLPPLPTCLCAAGVDCACIKDFAPQGAAAIAAAGQVNLFGDNLLVVTEVWFSDDCNIPAAATQKGAIKPGGTQTNIQVDPLAALLTNKHIIIVTTGGTCCSASTIGP